jgi:hypothetical protein
MENKKLDFLQKAYNEYVELYNKNKKYKIAPMMTFVEWIKNQEELTGYDLSL